MGWLKNFFKPRKQSSYYVAYEASDVTRVFDELEDVAVKKQKIVAYYERLQHKQQEMAQYDQITEEDLQKLTNWTNQYRGIVEQKQLLKGRLIRNNHALRVLSAYEAELPQLIEEVDKTEKQVKANERDLIYLQEEKESIREEREMLLKGYTFLKYFSAVFVGIMSIIVLVGFAMMQFLREAIWVYLSVVSVAFVVMLAGIVFAKDYIEKALRHNEKLQKKVMRYINKTKVRYFHNKRYLLFNFDKLGVDSSAKLQMYYDRYLKNRDNETQYGTLNRTLMQIEGQIVDLFDTYDITFDDMETLEKWLEVANKKQAYLAMQEELEKLMTQLKGFETFEETLWKEVQVLKEEGKQKVLLEQRLEQYQILTKQQLDKVMQTA